MRSPCSGTRQAGSSTPGSWRRRWRCRRRAGRSCSASLRFRCARLGPVDPTGREAVYQTLLEINNALISNLTREGLFHAVATAIGRVIPFDRIAVFLHDPMRDVLTLSILESSLPTTYFAVGLEMRPGESHVGWVFKEQKPLLRRNLATDRVYAADDWAHADGVRSYIIVPLLVRGRSIGTLAVASTIPDRYTEATTALLQEAAKQVALTVENMQAYEALTRAEEVLRAIAEGTAAVTGRDFFYSLVRYLASALRVRYAFLTECLPGTESRVRTLAFWKGDGFADNFEYDVAPTPCRVVLEGKTVVHPSDLQRLFPDDRELVDLSAQSFLGIPVYDSANQIAGHLAVLDDKPLGETGRAIPVLRAFAARAGAEIERLKAEERLRPERAAGSAAGQGQLQRDLRGPGRVRALRARQGCLHRGARSADRSLRASRRGHDLPRRGRRPPARDPGEAAARAAGARVRAGGQQPDPARERTGHRGYESEPGGGGGGGTLPRRPVLSPQRVPPPGPAAARSTERHPAAGDVLPGPLRQGVREARRGRLPADDGAPGRLRLAGECSRAAEHHRARGRPVLGSGARAGSRFAAARSTRGRLRRARGPGWGGDSRGDGAAPHPRGARAERLGDRRDRRRRPGPGAPSQHAAQPHEPPRHHPSHPRNLVAL